MDDRFTPRIPPGPGGGGDPPATPGVLEALAFALSGRCAFPSPVDQAYEMAKVDTMISIKGTQTIMAVTSESRPKGRPGLTARRPFQSANSRMVFSL